ncbi:hypothetical protein [Hydrogenimonas urashimensis]|uniref:hypothetical protein n=1 Tax=Hydrogenimonas urashimensis TaxID=2740515 RepID=UPI0019160A35|nr:hypothetical protein [Hydrogenimonas urashimensis]
MAWLDDFKIALIEEDEERLSSLIDRMPAFDTTDEIKRAMHLIDQARGLIIGKKRELAEEMKRVETSKKFLTSSGGSVSSTRLDITS